MTVYQHVQELISNTPLLELSRYPLPQGVRLYAKLEFMNPGGSVKDSEQLGEDLHFLQNAIGAVLGPMDS